MSSFWLIVVLGAVVIGVAIASGLYFFWPSRTERVSRSDLGVALLSGVLVAAAVLAIQLLFDWRLRQLDTRRADEAAQQEERQRIEAERQDFQLVVVQTKDLSGVRPPTTNLTHFFLRDRTLIEAKLNGVDLTDADLTGSDLTRAELAGAKLVGTTLTDTTLLQTDLDNATLVDVELTGAIMREAGLRGTTITGGNLERADLRGAQLQGATIRGVSLVEADLRGANIEGTNFSGTQGSDIKLEGASYDIDTTFPAGVKPPDEQCAAGMTCTY